MNENHALRIRYKSIAVQNKLESFLSGNSFQSRFARGTFWSTIGSAVSQTLTLVSSIALSNILGKKIFGELAMIQTTISMFGAFAGFGFGVTATKYVAALNKRDQDRTGKIISLLTVLALVFGTVIFILFFLLTPFLGRQVINAPHLEKILRIACFFILFNALNVVKSGALAGFEAFKTIAKSNILFGIARFFLIVLGAYIWGLYGAVVGLVSAVAVGLIINHGFLKKQERKAGVKRSYKNILEELPILWKFSLPTFFTSIIYGPAIWAASTILVNQPEGYSEMAIYSAAWSWFNVMLFLPRLFSSITMPIFADSYEIEDCMVFRQTLLSNMVLNTIITLPAAVILTIFSGYIMALYGESFAAGKFTLTTLAWAAVLLSVQKPLGQVFIVISRMWIYFLMNLFWAVLLIGIFWIIRSQGAVGLGISFLISYMVYALLSFYIVFRITLGRKLK